MGNDYDATKKMGEIENENRFKEWPVIKINWSFLLLKLDELVPNLDIQKICTRGFSKPPEETTRRIIKKLRENETR